MAEQLKSEQCGCKKCPEAVADIRYDPKENLTFKREIYVQTQNWARHNETLIVATNTILLGAVAAISSSFFKDVGMYGRGLLLVPVAVSFIGLLITAFLSLQYRRAISRIVVYERYFTLHGECPGISKSFAEVGILVKDWGNSFVPKYFHDTPRLGALSTKIFGFIHFLVITLFVVLYAMNK